MIQLETATAANAGICSTGRRSEDASVATSITASPRMRVPSRKRFNTGVFRTNASSWLTCCLLFLLGVLLLLLWLLLLGGGDVVLLEAVLLLEALVVCFTSLSPPPLLVLRARQLSALLLRTTAEATGLAALWMVGILAGLNLSCCGGPAREHNEAL